MEEEDEMMINCSKWDLPVSVSQISIHEQDCKHEKEPKPELDFCGYCNKYVDSAHNCGFAEERRRPEIRCIDCG